MYPKRLLFIIALSVTIMLLLMYLIYDFDMNLMNLSNIFFFIGIACFFLGLIIVSGATDIFYSSRYLARRMFFKDKGNGNYFKTFSDYKEYKDINNLKYNTKGKGVDILLVGVVYIIISLLISTII